MTGRLTYLFELDEYPQNGRLAKYEKELKMLIKTKDDNGIKALSKRIFTDCINYLKTSFDLKIPDLYLGLLNHRRYTELCDKIDLVLGKRPRTYAIILGDNLGSQPEVYIDFEKHYSFYLSTGKPINFLINLIASYTEEIIHSADPSKLETEIHQIVCDALEGFAEIKLTEDVKEQRLSYAKKADATKKLK